MQIVCLADKGGVGKTTIAMHMAARYAQMGLDVGLMDLDGRQASKRILGGSHNPNLRVYRMPERPGRHDVVIWDTPAHPSIKLLASLVAQADVILVVATGDTESQVAAIELCHRMEGETEASIAILLNNLHPTLHAAGLRTELGAWGVDICETVLRRYACYEHARAQRQLVCDYPYANADRAWNDVCALVSEIEEAVHAQATAA